jgi:hypothetical protein
VAEEVVDDLKITTELNRARRMPQFVGHRLQWIACNEGYVLLGHDARSFETSGTDYAVTQRHAPEEWSPHPNRCRNFILAKN